MWKGVYIACKYATKTFLDVDVEALWLDWVCGPLFTRLIQSTHGPLAPWNNVCALLPPSRKKDKTFIIGSSFIIVTCPTFLSTSYNSMFVHTLAPV
jgi:hypothetical protein